MSDRIDIAAVAGGALSMARSLIPEWLPAGRVHGAEYRCGGLDGTPGESFAVNLNTGRWSDFASPDHRGGDLVSLYAAIHRVSQLEAARKLADVIGAGTPLVARVAVEEWTPILPVPSHAPPPPAAHFKHGKPVHVARYLDKDGALLGLIYRCEPDQGKKEILPLTYCGRADGKQEWRWKSLPKPRSLYGAELLVERRRVLLVEGEGKADAARRMLEGCMSVLAWAGGAQAVQHADWSLLAGRDVTIWPDADSAGAGAAAAITIQLRHLHASVRTVELPSGVERGWDLADAEREGWDGDRVMSYVDPPVYDVVEYEEPEHEAEGQSEYYRPLGQDRSRFYIFSYRAGQVLDFTSAQLAQMSTLMELAPLMYWETNYPARGDKGGCNQKAASDDLLKSCLASGIYDAERVRGRGAWIDNGRSVLHVGNKLIVDGEQQSLILPDSKNIYEAARTLTNVWVDPIGNRDANKLVTICNALSWQAPTSGLLLAGWIVVAPICGGLAWRPSIWITGGAGSGKTYLKENIIAPALGGMALMVQSKTSEAGIRQTLGSDALPVLFDEAEGEDTHAKTRMQGVLDLVRQSSSEGGADIIKGSQTGSGAKRYRIRSCFALQSINIGIEHQADESRITVLALNERNPKQAAENEAAFAEINRLVQETITPNYGAGLLARSVTLLPVIRANAETFSQAASIVFGSRRKGDQLGALLAGAYSLYSKGKINVIEAEKFIREREWKDATAAPVERDEMRMVNYILHYRIKTNAGNMGMGEMSVEGLIALASGGDEYKAEAAENVLKEHGIRCGGVGSTQGVWIAGGHTRMKAILTGTPWGSSVNHSLNRINGVNSKDNKPMRYGPIGGPIQSVFVPFASFSG